MDENGNAAEGTAADAAKEAATQLKAEAEQAMGEIKGRGIGGFFSFDRLYFPLVAKYVFILLVVMSLVSMAAGIIGGFVIMFYSSFFGGIMTVLMSVVCGVFGIIVTRLWFEFFMVGFNINENLEKIRNMK